MTLFTANPALALAEAFGRAASAPDIADRIGFNPPLAPPGLNERIALKATVEVETSENTARIPSSAESR